MVLGECGHGGKVGIAQLLPRRHGAVGTAFQHRVHHVGRGAQHHGAAVECLDRACALAVGLVAGRAVGGIDLFATGNQIGQVPHLVRVVLLGGGLLLFLFHPLGVILGRQHLHVDGHVGMLLAAQLGALAVVVARLLGAEPGVAHEAGDRILLDAEGGHHERVDHVLCGGNHAHLLVDGHDQRIVHLQQIVIGRLAHVAAVGHLALRHVQRGDVFQPLAFAAEVVIAPLPLVAGGLHGEVGVGRVFLRHQHLGGGQRHQDHDDEGDDGPDHFDGDGLVEIGGLGATGFAMLPDGIEHHGEHADEDHRADDEHHPVQEVLLFGDARDGWREIELFDGRTAGKILYRVGCCAHPRAGHQQHRSQLIGNALHSSHLLLSLNLTNPLPWRLRGSDQRQSHANSTDQTIRQASPKTEISQPDHPEST
ncbi:hypothetical protein SDC9_91016 [bioreactor metagenome]|uniref:Uncharacterized protein n=1 Tax=bioreactor metagenome TaxID=1076179 RepID=A0A644ZV77_9ZZZZ